MRLLLYDQCMANFVKYCQIVFQSATPFCILSSSVENSSCSTSLSTLGVLNSFDFDYSSEGMVVLICISLMTNDVSCTSWLCIYLLVWNVCSNILSISWWGREVVCLPVIEWLLKYILDKSPLSDICFAEVLNFDEVLFVVVVWFDLRFLCLA